MLNPGNYKGHLKTSKMSSKTSSGGGDDDLTSLSWLQTVNILPDSVTSDDEPSSPDDTETETEKFSFKNVDSVHNKVSSNRQNVKTSKVTPTPTFGGNTFRLSSNTSSQFSSNIMITSTTSVGGTTTTTYSPSSVLLNSLLVSTASSSMERRSPFNVGEKNIVVVSTPSQNGIYPDIRTTNSIPAQVGLKSNKLLINNIYCLNQTLLMIAVILGRLLNQDSLDNTVKFSFTKLL
jgi:hypothetical protein